MRIVPHPPAGPLLVRDYLQGREGARLFYDGGPEDLGAYRDRWSGVQRRFDARRRQAAAAALRPTSDRSRARLERFVREGGAMVTTGQQAGLFGGPLYTLYKALTAARLAASLEVELGVVVLPVFWIASEDHDWAEIDHTWMVDAGDELRRISIQGLNTSSSPVSERRLEGVGAALDEVSDVIENIGDGADWLTLLRGVYRPGAPVAAAFGDLLGALLGGFDFCMADAADRPLKEASIPILEEEIRAPELTERCLTERADALTAAGYETQVPLLPGAAQLFVHTALGRERLLHAGSERTARESRERWSAEALIQATRADPVRVSPNALLRPVVEAHLFPTLAYVGGPAELAYLAQAAPLFGRFGLRAPVAVPRLSVTLVESRIDRYLQRLGLEVGDLSAPRHELLARLVRAHLPSDVTTAVQALRTGLVEGFAGIEGPAAEIDPTLRGAVGSARNRALGRVARLQRRIEREFRRRHGEIERRLDAVLHRLRPGGEPQERVLNALPFVASGGEHLLRELLEAVSIPWEEGSG
jgi:bacillithiol synthase